MATILLVDDNNNLVQFTAKNIETAVPGLSVLKAGSCQQAREIAAEKKPVMVVLDRRLPDGDGIALMQELLRQVPGLQCVVVTADASETFNREAMNKGAMAVLAKPFEAEQIIAMVQRVVGSPGSANPPVPKGRKEDSDTVIVDRHLIINRLAGLLAGLRAFGADLRAEANENVAIHKIIDEYLERMVATVREISELMGQVEIGQVGSRK
jgi:DNA-binding NtrC family response regulator